MQCVAVCCSVQMQCVAVYRWEDDTEEYEVVRVFEGSFLCCSVYVYICKYTHNIYIYACICICVYVYVYVYIYVYV